MLHVGALNPRLYFILMSFITEVGLKSSSGRHLGVIKTIWLPKLLFKRTFVNHVTGRERLIRSRSSARFCFELSGNFELRVLFKHEMLCINISQ